MCIILGHFNFYREGCPDVKSGRGVLAVILFVLFVTRLPCLALAGRPKSTKKSRGGRTRSAQTAAAPNPGEVENTKFMNNLLNIIDEEGNVIRQETREKIHKLGLLHQEINVWF